MVEAEVAVGRADSIEMEGRLVMVEIVALGCSRRKEKRSQQRSPNSDKDEVATPENSLASA
jgi:hypothetical protein